MGVQASTSRSMSYCESLGHVGYVLVEDLDHNIVDLPRYSQSYFSKSMLELQALKLIALTISKHPSRLEPLS